MLYQVQPFSRVSTAASQASAFRTAYLNEQWCLHETCCFASQVRVQAATSLPVGLKASLPERLGLMSSCLSAHPTVHGILSTSPPDTVSWTCTSLLRVYCCRRKPKRRVLSSDFLLTHLRLNRVERGVMRQRWPSGLRALVLIIISSQEVLRQFITIMMVHPRHPDE